MPDRPTENLAPIHERFPGLVAGTDLSNSQPDIVEVIVERPGAPPVAYALRMLTAKRFNRIGVLVKNPDRMPNRLDPEGRQNPDGTTKMLFDPDWGDWRERFQAAQDKRMFWRLIEALEGVPDDYEWESVPGTIGPVRIPGDTLDDKLAWMMDKDTGFEASVTAALSGILVESGARGSVIARATTFRSVPGNGT